MSDLLRCLRQHSLNVQFSTPRLASSARLASHLILLIAVGILTSGCAKQAVVPATTATPSAPTVLKIGVLLPLSGEYERFGTLVLNGVSCALGLTPPCTNDLTTAQLVTRDTQGKPDLAVSMARDLIEQEKVVAIIGPLLSQELEALAGQLPDNHPPILSLAPQQKKSEEKNIFQYSLFPEQEVAAIAEQMKIEEKTKVIVLAPDNSYGKQYHELLQKLAEEAKGPEIVAAIFYPPDIPDFTGLLEKNLKTLRACDAIFIPDSYRTVRQIAAGLDRLQIENARLFGTSRWHHPELLTQPPAILEQAIFVTPFHPSMTRESVQKFSQTFFTAYTQSPTWMSAFGYDATRILLSAAMEKRKDYTTLTGSLYFDDNGVAVFPYASFRIVAGQFVDQTKNEGISTHSNSATPPPASP